MFYDATIYTLPLIAAVIGYLTNYVAIKMLFHPRKPVEFLGLKIQGVFPKRRGLLAKSIGDLVSRRLLSVESIIKSVNPKEVENGIESILAPEIDRFLKEELHEKLPMISMFLSESFLDSIRDVLVEKLKSASGANFEKTLRLLFKDLNIEAIVEKKVLEFSVEELEEVLSGILKKEFRFIELVGAVLGFMIGLIQVGLIHFPTLHF